MARITVLGAGICGLAAATMLACDGHEVTVLERDPEPAPESEQAAWESWTRGGVAQFRQAHYLQPPGRAMLERELPDVLDALVAAGGCRFDVLSIMPPTITDREPRPGDERYVTVTARRPVLEHVLARAAESQRGLDLRRGVAVDGLVADGAGGAVPRVTGVHTATGERIDGDLVVDAMGRSSRLPRWVAGIAGAAINEEAEDSGFIYYTRFFGARPGAAVPGYRSPVITPLGTMSILILLGDNDTWSVTLYASAGDRPLKQLRDSARWEAVLAACPAHAHWLDGDPITGVLPMGGIVDRYRRLVVDGRPLVSGVALLGDACACTNPSAGRGMALGLRHAARLREAARTLDDPLEFATRWDELTEAQQRPWYDDTIREDRARLREIEALRRGERPPGPAGPYADVLAALPAAVPYDPDLFRAYVDIRTCNATLVEVLARPGLAERMIEVASDHEPLRPPGPDREQLLALVA
jgi:2-polyprenyl-6-methoxyphenol hydroxylase-like FAD-dependent oxidoreductase